MKVKCPKCKSNNLNINKSIFHKIPVMRTVLTVLIAVGIWNILASIYGKTQYTCANCGKNFK